jgi:uncharacterized protein YdiU (UPF0061 family)
MSDLKDEINKAKNSMNDAFAAIVSENSGTDIRKEKYKSFMQLYTTSLKKTSDEYKFSEKILKSFENENFESIKFFIESNYDRYNEISRLIKKYSDNFDEKEIAKCKSKVTVLEKSMIFFLENGL